MIRVIYDGNLGNNLFQYCFARLLAERMGYRLQADPIPGFVRTRDVVSGAIHHAGPPIVLRGQRPDLSVLDGSDPQREVVLTGYFQRSGYYTPYRETIRDWLVIDAGYGEGDIGEDDVVVGVRRGRDYIPRHGLPLSYYEEALSGLTYSRVHICSDSPNDPFVKYLAKRYAATVRPAGALDNLAFIRRFRKIVISNSTFLWWAAFLSDAQIIVFPRPANGFWSATEPLSKNISLELDDPRYRYLAAAAYRPAFAGERASILYGRSVEAVKGCLRPFWARHRAPLPPRLVFGEDEQAH